MPNNKVRVDLNELYLGEPVQFGQRYTYATTHPLEDVMGPGYFDAARFRLRPGDTIRATRLASKNREAPDNHVLAFVDLIVAANDKHVEVQAEGRLFRLPGRGKFTPPKEEILQPQEHYIEDDGAEVKEGKGGKFEVELGGKVVAKADDMDAALRIAAGEDPLPA